MGRVRKRKHSLHHSVGAVSSGGKRARESLYILKINHTPEELFDRFRKVVTSPEHLRPVHGEPFPSSYDEMFSAPSVGHPAGLVNEAVWSICRCCMHGSELTAYLETREKFEASLLRDAFEEAAELLITHQSKMGISLWLAQAWITLGENAPAGLKRSLQQEADTVAPHSVAAFILRYLARRAESRGPKNFLKDEIIAKLGKVSDLYSTYAAARVFDLNSATSSELSVVLFIEAQGSLIDHYEALIVTLQNMAFLERLPSDIAKALKKPVSVLRRRVGDRRLKPIALAFGCNLEPEIYVPVQTRVNAFEAYFRGLYQDAASSAALHLTDVDPTDSAVIALLARSVIRSDSELPNLPRSLEAICKSLIVVMKLGEQAYGEATTIFSTVDRHYGHSWALYLRSLVMLCLQQESAEPTINQMRELAVLDPYVSPLTLACTRSILVKQVCRQLSENRAYLHTMSAIELLYFGIKPADTRLEVTERRKLSYSGRYEIENKNYDAAVISLEKLLKIAPPNAKYRLLSLLAIAKAKRKFHEESLALLVDAYIANSAVPTSLPLNEVVKEMNDAENWPHTIDVPISFELYNAFSSGNRLAELRYAFERYQQINSIVDPVDLAEKLGERGKTRAILYLDRVWTPEVMRQTLLYQGSQKIEEARINVCRQLASIDPDNSALYFDEVRERVKQQEIAKGMSLIEQSKVYVDIAAMKRILKAKIGGQYSRYKANSVGRDDASLVAVERITDALIDFSRSENLSIINALSSVHLLDESETETDSQFDPIFTEVTHEFLRGDHGLNAYLSTRVRHGVLRNTLRKPLVDERLMATRDESGQMYKRNQHWDDRLEGHDANIRDQVALALERFTASFDIFVQELRDEYLQIAISHGVKDVRNDSKAAFVYRSSNLERRFLQRYAVRSRTIEEFIDVCIDNLWEKTDENLLGVRKLIDHTMRPRFISLLDQLTEDLVSVPYSMPIADLRNGIARAKTRLRIRLDEVSSWFKRSQVYDRQDYQAGLPVEIAFNMIAKTISESSIVPNLNISSYDRNLRMPGRTLDGMVDVFYIILSNAIEHSGLGGGDLDIYISFSFSSGRYEARVESSLHSSVPNTVQKLRVDSIRESLNQSESRRLAQIEGGSGLHKLWRSIHSPFYEAPSLSFGFTAEDERFYVDISYNIKASDENLDR